MTQLIKYFDLPSKKWDITTKAPFHIDLWVIDCGDRKYLLTYGKKLSTNFFVNMYYFLLKGTCREIVCEPLEGWVFAKKLKYVTEERVARNYFRLFKASC